MRGANLRVDFCSTVPAMKSCERRPESESLDILRIFAIDSIATLANFGKTVAKSSSPMDSSDFSTTGCTNTVGWRSP